MPGAPTPALVQINHDILTAYLPGGKTRMMDNSLPDENRLVTAGAAWRASPATARDLDLLDEDVAKSGGRRIRLSDLYRPIQQQAEQRLKYDTWVAARKPKPGTAGWNPNTMRVDYVKRPGESNHNWGGAFDVDVEALGWPDAPPGNAALNRFWQLAGARGFTPIIAHPDVEQSECWHFDHLGPLAKVRELAIEHGAHDPYTVASVVGCTLFGQTPIQGRSLERYLQARLLLGGTWCGAVDGEIGKLTLAALKSLKITSFKGENAVNTAISALDQQEYAFAELAAL